MFNSSVQHPYCWQTLIYFSPGENNWLCAHRDTKEQLFLSFFLHSLPPTTDPSFALTTSVFSFCIYALHVPYNFVFFYHHVSLNSSQLWQKATGFYVLCVCICCRSFLYAVSRSGTPKFRGQINSCQEGLIPGERQRNRQREGEQEVRN